MKRLCLVALSLVALSTTALAQEATREEFQELSGLYEGHWVAEITDQVNVPGVSAKGQTQTAHFDVKRDAGGHLLIGRFYLGKFLAVVTTAYNPADKKIAFSWVSSDGAYGTGSFYKKGPTWMQDMSATYIDGTRHETHASLTFSDDNTKYRINGTAKINGKSVPDLDDTYVRVSK